MTSNWSNRSKLIRSNKSASSFCCFFFCLLSVRWTFRLFVVHLLVNSSRTWFVCLFPPSRTGTWRCRGNNERASLTPAPPPGCFQPDVFYPRKGNKNGIQWSDFPCFLFLEIRYRHACWGYGDLKQVHGGKWINAGRNWNLERREKRRERRSSALLQFRSTSVPVPAFHVLERTSRSRWSDFPATHRGASPPPSPHGRNGRNSPNAPGARPENYI